ncbi:hypothetical protein [Solitalea koreensis]|uniref:DUF2946 domain-containing protein n=1 Tax=Solitalea koreensis TaxID=543615 RepID=A0A521AZW1_9SPHI|nr:hypothetical protein [Solitalea koreensis]SMO40311.1 hypothetical protein SAMN06265350_101558 [Solitalea koreensis]
MIHTAKKRNLKTWLSGLLFAVFLITQIPFAAFHNHSFKNPDPLAKGKTEQSAKISDSDGASPCAVCNFHFIKDYSVEQEAQLLVQSVVFKSYLIESVKAATALLTLRQLRAPPVVA